MHQVIRIMMSMKNASFSFICLKMELIDLVVMTETPIELQQAFAKLHLRNKRPHTFSLSTPPSLLPKKQNSLTPPPKSQPN